MNLHWHAIGERARELGAGYLLYHICAIKLIGKQALAQHPDVY